MAEHDSGGPNDSRWAPPQSSVRQESSGGRVLPFSSGWPLVVGALVGLVLRLIFSGKPGDAYATMLGSFIYLAPLIVGAVTVYLAERLQPRSWLYYAGAGFLANVLFVLGSLVVLIEGMICAVVIAPLFGLMGAVGGLLMGVVCRWTGRPGRMLSCAALVPLVLGALEPALPIAKRLRTVERSVAIAASPAQVWHAIQHATDIQPHEVERGWIFRIGVPLPQGGITEETAEGRVRRITMGKSVHFDQIVTRWEPERLMRVRYRYAADSFPPNAMDEHVVLGGHYFDVEEADYELTPQGETTQLTIRMRYRVSTPFNWYADPIARALFADFEAVMLELYRRRSERAQS